jgi:hypothetical protein
MPVRQLCPKVNLKIRGVDFVTNLIVLELKGISIILGMDWLSKHKVIIDCAKKSVKLTTQEGKEMEFAIEQVVTDKGAANRVKVNQLDASQGSEVPVVNEFPDVFSKELPGMPPDRDIEFVIELKPDTTPIYKTPCRMATLELAELKEHIKELLEKGFIHPSSSPFGAPEIFVLKKDGTQRSTLTNAPTYFMYLMNKVFMEYLDKFVAVFIDDILVYSRSEEELEEHLRLALQKLLEHRLYEKLSKCEFWMKQVGFLGHIISNGGISVDPSKVQDVLRWNAPTSVGDIWSCLGLAGYYQRFIEGFLKISKPMT